VIGANQTAELPASISFVPLSTTVSLRTTTNLRLGFAFRLDISTVAEPDSHAYRIVPVSYGYRFSDRSGHELLAYHWHPDGLSSIVHPHLHISSRVRSVPLEPDGGSLNLADHHIPTGSVTLVDVVRYLIDEIGIEPRRSD
jgi:hypothetical protein